MECPQLPSAFAQASIHPNQRPAVLTRHVPEIKTTDTTFLNALVEIGRQSNQCFGIILTRRSSANLVVSEINERNIEIGTVIEKLLASAKDFQMTVRGTCIVLGPAAQERPQYLLTLIPTFRISRISLDEASYELYFDLQAAERPKSDKITGVIRSVPSNSDSPEIGPLFLRSQSVESILCKLATEAKGTMWIALPKQNNVPWRFIWYTETSQVISMKLREILGAIPEQ